ncbi:MAG: 4'-phosphopantetheinyl transferase superfamily protein [Cyanothece sp. SIO1E1]|nr:4'-phosphopantetheinyl transferase superfamily protein [Cyanothece sp. SIO1E1]
MVLPDCLWIIPSEEPVLSSGSIHLWCASLDPPAAQIQHLAQLLSPDERVRAERFHFQKDSRHFTVARGILRILLSRYLQLEPGQLQFEYGSRGKPALTAICGGEQLSFNLSHSHGLALYAIAPIAPPGNMTNAELGVDIEYIRPLDTAEQLAQRFFSAQEYAVIQKLPAADKQEAFFHYWTCKEAYIKATGDGLAKSLDQVEVLITPGEPARFVKIDGDWQKAADWQVKQLLPATGYIAALVAKRHNWHVNCWQWSWL